MDAFSKLPNELVVMIFEYLEMADVVWRCGLVSKRFQFLAHQVRFKELVIVNGSVNFDNYWHCNFERINPRRTVCERDLHFLTASFRSSFINLRKLKLDLMTGSDFDIDILSEFVRLQHLELSRLQLKEDKTICLPSARLIRIIRIDHGDRQVGKLTVNAAELRTFLCDHLGLYQLTDSRAIEHLQLEVGSEQLAEAPSLRVLRAFQGLKLDRNVLSKVPNLERLHLHCPFNDDDEEELGEIDESREIVVHFLALKKLLRMFALKVYFNGVHLADVQSANAYFNQDFNLDELVRIQHNYEQLESTLPWMQQIFYWNLLAIFNDALPSDFFKRFNNIRSIQHAGDTETQQRFVAFLENCPNLSEIKLIYPNFTPAFYEQQLPELAPLLSHLSLREKKELKIDYSFIRRFKLLLTFETTQNLDMDWVLNSVAQFKILRRFAFSSGRNNVLIEKFAEDRYSLRYDPRGEANIVQACKRDIGFDSLREECLSLEKQQNDGYQPKKFKGKPGKKRRS